MVVSADRKQQVGKSRQSSVVAAPPVLTQSEILEMCATELSIPKAQARRFFEYLGQLAYDQVRKSGSFILPQFGKLTLTHRKERMGRNPQTGDQIVIPAKTVAKFKLNSQMKNRVMETEATAGGPAIASSATGR